MYKYGKVVNFRIRIVVAADVTLSAATKIVNVGYIPMVSNQRCTLYKMDAPYVDTTNGAYLDEDGVIKLPISLTLQAGSYNISTTYICK